MKPKREYISTNELANIQSLSNDIAEYFAGERVPVRRTELVRLIVVDAQRTKLWPSASYEQWDAAIDVAASRGLIVLDGDWVRHTIPEAKPVSGQMGFDFGE